METLRTRVGLGMLTLAIAGGAAALATSPKELPRSTVTPSEPAPLIIPVSSPSPETPTPSPDPRMSLDWSGPPSVVMNRPTEYTLSVRNPSSQAAQKVVVQVRPAAGVTVGRTSPAATVVDGVYMWELGTLDSRSATHLKMMLSTSNRSDMACQAWVTFTGSSGMKVAVREPELKVALKSPDTVILGDTVRVEYVVKNVGDAPAENVRYGMFRKYLGSSSSDEIDVEAVGPTSRLDTLEPGEETTGSREFRAEQGGEILLSALAEIDGVRSNPQTTIRVLVPKLSVSMDGPASVLVGRKAEYTARIENVGDVPLALSQLQPRLPAGWQKLTIETAPKVGDELKPGESATVRFSAVPNNTGTSSVNFEVEGRKRQARVNEMAYARTQVEGIAALRMELVDLVDPVERGEETTYEIRVTNTGTKSDTNVVITCPLPEQLKFVSARGPVAHSVKDLGSCTVVRFEPVRELAPKTDVVYRVTVQAVNTGDVRFKAQLNSQQLSTSVVKEESTRVFGD